VYVAHLSSLDMLSDGATAEMERYSGEIERELCTQAAGRLRASGAAWEFERRPGIVVDELIAAAAAIGEAHPDEILAIIVGSSSPGNHRVAGSVAVGLARHSPVPLVIVP
jgi:nucleotide-binding universal stress UspA family protein